MKYKIGDSFYKQSTWGIFTYIIFGIQTLETKGKKIIFYNVQCQECSDHDKCELALKINDYGKIEYSHMLNNDDEYSDKQFYWHNDGGKSYGKEFFETKKECMIDTYYKTKDLYIKENQEGKEKIERNILKIKQIEEKIEILNND